jgi:hypothetical protein
VEQLEPERGVQTGADIQPLHANAA